MNMIIRNKCTTELNRSTHVNATGDIGTFKITESIALSAGQRRIFAVTGSKAIELFQETFNIVKIIGQEFKIKKEEVLECVSKQKDQIKELQQAIKQIKSKLI